MRGFKESDFLYCWECYKQRSRIKWEEYIKHKKPDAVVWRQETRDVISGYCEAHKRASRHVVPDWHSVDRSTWHLATFNGKPYKEE